MGLLNGLDVEGPGWMKSKVTLQGSGHKHSMYVVPFTELVKSRGDGSLGVKNQKFREVPIKLEVIIGLRSAKFRSSDRGKCFKK